MDALARDAGSRGRGPGSASSRSRRSRTGWAAMQFAASRDHDALLRELDEHLPGARGKRSEPLLLEVAVAAGGYGVGSTRSSSSDAHSPSTPSGRAGSSAAREYEARAAATA